MSRFFTSDLHFGSGLINKYAHRPFSDAKDAVDKLVASICETCGNSDTVIHVGDFMLTGSDRHGETEDHGLDYSLDDYLAMLPRRMVLLSGNHDDGHNCEADCKSMVLDLNQNYRNVYVNHFPSDHPDYHGLVGNGKRVQINLCGHVHDKWLYKWDSEKRVLNVNVGVDVWGYKPVRDSEITEMLDLLTGKKIDKTGLDFSSGKNIIATRKEHDAFVNMVKWQVSRDRERRKEEKYAKKGLTPEERERRRVEAMKKKGLI